MNTPAIAPILTGEETLDEVIECLMTLSGEASSH